MAPPAPSRHDIPSKQDVYDFWNQKACGEVYAGASEGAADLFRQEQIRYELEPYIFDFAKFAEGAGRDVLEIGVGMGADHLQWAKAHPRKLAGIDLTERAVAFSRERLAGSGFKPRVEVGDAESLQFPDASFDIVYSWGVLHHTPDTGQAIREIHRVLRPNGVARVMMYHRRSITGWILWVRYSLLRGKLMSISEIYARYLESPGTQAFSLAEARDLLRLFSAVAVSTRLGTGDLLLGEAGQRHSGTLLRLLRRLWPRWLLKRFFPTWGLVMLIEARK